MNTASCIILTFKEWTNWVTFGLLRNSQRIRAYTGTQKSFNDLLGITPDITHLEDNEFIVAKLHDSYHQYIYHDDYLSLEAVECFYALSQRGKSLLLHTADKMKVVIDVDEKIEKYWDVWCAQQIDIMAKNKAQKFCEIMFIDEDFTISEFEKIIYDSNNPFIKNLKLFKGSFDNKKRCPERLEKSYYNTKSYGGTAALFLIKNIIIGDKFPKLSANYNFITKELLDVQKYYDRLKGIQTYTELTEVFFDSNIICEKIILEKIIKEEIQDNIPLLALSMYFHYEMLIDTEKEINLNALKFDLKILEMLYENSYPNISYLIVYLLGEKPALSYTMVNTLYYTKKIESLSCIKTEYFETIKSKLPDGFVIENIDKLYEEATKLINNYERKIKEKFYPDVKSEKHADLTPKSDTISDDEQITSPQVNDKGESDESRQRGLFVDDNGKTVDDNGKTVDDNGKTVDDNGKTVDDNGKTVDDSFEFFTKIKKLIGDRVINESSTWEDLAEIFTKNKNEITREIKKIGVTIRNRRFETIFNDLKKRLEMY